MGHNAFDLVLIVLAVVILPGLSILMGRRLAGAPAGSLVPRYAFTVVRGWAVVALVMVGWWWNGRPFAWLGLDIPVSLYGLVGLGLDAVLALVMVSQLLRPLSSLKPDRLAVLRRQMAEIKILPRTRGEFLFFLPVAVTAGVWEELLYRGFLFWFFSGFGIVVSILVSTVAFGAGHLYQDVRGAARAFLLGLVFASAYAMTQSLWWLIVIHAMIDVFGGINGRRLSKLPEPA